MKTNGIWFSYMCLLWLTDSPEKTTTSSNCVPTPEFVLQASCKERATTPDPINFCSRKESTDHPMEAPVISNCCKSFQTLSLQASTYLSVDHVQPQVHTEKQTSRDSAGVWPPTLHRRAEQEELLKAPRPVFSANAVSFPMTRISPFFLLQLRHTSILAH